MEDLIKRQDVYDMLHNIGGCGAEKGTWDDGWDKAIDTAIKELEDIPVAYDVDIIIKELEERLKFYEKRFNKMNNKNKETVEDWGSIKAYKDAIAIVEGVVKNET